MMRIAAIVSVLFACLPALVAAQPKRPKPVPAKQVPAEAPIDPYADPPAEKPDPDAKAIPATAPAKPAKRPVVPISPRAPAPAIDTKPAPADPIAPIADARAPGKLPARVGVTDVVAIQGLLAVQRLDGWLLFDRDGANPIAARVVAPEGRPLRPWFYLIPAKGEPIALVHGSEKRSFDHLPGKQLTYASHREIDKQLRAMLKGQRQLAAEYSPKSAVPAVSRVDAGTLELIRSTGVQVRSSETLVQYTKAIWGEAGRTAHFVAVHHLVELRKDALAFIAQQLRANAPVTDWDVQQRLVRGLAMRGLASAPPAIATGANTADPYYVPSAAKAAAIQRGDLIVLSLAAKIDKPDGVWAAQTWCAVADAVVRDDWKQAFETVRGARDRAIALIAERGNRNRPVTGADVDQAARAFIKKAGAAAKVMHRTGHSIDNDLQGGGANLDDFEVRDKRILVTGTGVTVGPGIYTAGQFGVRTEISVYLAPSGPEITTPAQDAIEPLLAGR